MDIRKVKKLIEMLEESGIAEIEIHEGEESVRVSRHSSVPPAASASQTVTQVSPLAQTAPAESAAGNNGGNAEQASAGHVVKSPMVGIYYESSSPGKPPFVEQGQKVAKGDILCVIEAMKIMNQVESDATGVITRIMVENGNPVEYGQSLFTIREE